MLHRAPRFMFPRAAAETANRAARPTVGDIILSRDEDGLGGISFGHIRSAYNGRDAQATLVRLIDLILSIHDVSFVVQKNNTVLRLPNKTIPKTPT